MLLASCAGVVLAHDIADSLAYLDLLDHRAGIAPVPFEYSHGQRLPLLVCQLPALLQ